MYIIDAVHKPRGIGKVGKGALAGMHQQHLAATVLKAIRDRNNIDTADKEGRFSRSPIPVAHVATANIGDCPTLILNAPVPAAKKVLPRWACGKRISICGRSMRPSPWW